MTDVDAEAHDHERLTAYAVGLLPGHDRAALAAHVEKCQGCRAELAELRALDIAMRAMPPELFRDGPRGHGPGTSTRDATTAS
ncbi:MAG: zf-HC2 domain-containing protein [Mycobacterium sp.]|nr:zf-HC2 domain-containing protein [Mycobacterium sp.]